MLLDVKEMIALLRNSVNIQQKNDGVEDPAYSAMTDDDIGLYLKLGASRATDVGELSLLDQNGVYPVLLLAKMELYTRLATLQADKVDLGADNNNYIKQSQRFDHYMKLRDSAKAEYELWLENEGKNKVESYDVLLSNRHYTNRNYEKQVTPKVSIIIDSLTNDGVKFHWNMKNTSHFGRYKVYLGTSPVIDLNRDGALYSDKLLGEPILLKSTGNIRDNFHEIEGLNPDTTYYLAVFSIERNQVFGVSQISFTTLKALADEEDTSTRNLGGVLGG